MEAPRDQGQDADLWYEVRIEVDQEKPVAEQRLERLAKRATSVAAPTLGEAIESDGCPLGHHELQEILRPPKGGL